MTLFRHMRSFKSLNLHSYLWSKPQFLADLSHKNGA